FDASVLSRGVPRSACANFARPDAYKPAALSTTHDGAFVLSGDECNNDESGVVRVFAVDADAERDAGALTLRDARAFDAAVNALAQSPCGAWLALGLWCDGNAACVVAFDARRGRVARTTAAVCAEASRVLNAIAWS